jgi:hypothetical protein
VRAVRCWRWQQRIHFRALSPPYLLQRYGFGSKPQSISSVAFKTILGSDSEDGQKKLGRDVNGRQSWEVQEWEVLVKPAHISFQKPCQRVARGKDKILG